MSKLQFVIMTITDTGDPLIETDKFEGVGCEAMHKAFAEDLGGMDEMTYKPEHRLKPVVAKQKAKARQ